MCIICTLCGHHQLHPAWSLSSVLTALNPALLSLLLSLLARSAVVAAVVARTLSLLTRSVVVAHTLCCRCSHALLSLLARSAVVACATHALLSLLARRTLCCRCSHALLSLLARSDHHLHPLWSSSQSCHTALTHAKLHFSRTTLLSLMQYCISVSVVQHCSLSCNTASQLCNTASQCQSCNALTHATLHLSRATLHLTHAILHLSRVVIIVCTLLCWSTLLHSPVLVDSVALSCAGRLCTRCCSLLLITGVDHSLTRC